MPLYNYRCPDCGYEFEEFIHSISKVDETLVNCPQCLTKAARLLNPGTKYQIATGNFFEPYMETDLGPEPVLIKSVDHLRKECEARGLGCRKMPPKVVDSKR